MGLVISKTLRNSAINVTSPRITELQTGPVSGTKRCWNVDLMDWRLSGLRFNVSAFVKKVEYGNLALSG